MNNVKELSIKEMQQVTGGDQMSDGVNYGKGSSLSKGGAKCGLGIVGGLATIPSGPLGWLAGAAGVINSCMK
uniref:Bacteriocin carnobacteriocin-A n=1 Tax=Carnobacterium maltaromaticum TaxID=2751 RepID=CBA_CARML|nr:RecName: Full=Bacteriocin carnobacteriocin-A; AltName: Full=Piscicolin-61; Flags: Precursor [Carnobacterium maltaromaticum]AAA23016.1 carnobacteriocin A [Carnobacterium maltaromaticum]CAA81391.1 piscicolin 61 [Carnobacterium maltaromaticum]